QLLPDPAGLLAQVGDAALRGHDRLGPDPAAAGLLLAAAVPTAPGHGLEAPEVEPGAEAPALTRQDDDAHRRVALQPLPGIDQASEHGPVEGVQLVGSVEPDIGDAIGHRDGHAV